MASTKKGIVLCLALALIGARADALRADASLLVYPSSTAVFRYDPNRYEVVTAGDPRFDPAYAVGGLVLWDQVESRIPVEVYRAPDLIAFEPSTSGYNEYLTYRNSFTVIVDGYGEHPRSLANLHMRFHSSPYATGASIMINGSPTSPLCPIAGFPVVTPTGDGHYADVVEHELTWTGPVGLRISVFMDKNFNGVFDGGRPQFTIFAIDGAVPVRETSWGQIKAIYGD